MWYRAALVHRVAGDVENAAENAFAHRHGNRRACRLDRQPALQAFGGTHRDRAHPAFAEMLLHFEDESVGLARSPSK